jgi:hypothetical protein
MLLYVEAIRHRATKQVPDYGDRAINIIREEALRLLRYVPDERFHCDWAKP